MLRSSHTDGVTTLTLARLERGNALGPDLVETLLAAVQAASNDDTVHTLLLRGEGRHFCTGLDLSDLDQCRDGDLLQRLVRIETLLAAVWHAPVRTVALAQGRTWGAGADLFAACEVRLATTRSVRDSLHGAKMGPLESSCSSCCPSSPSQRPLWMS